MTCNITCVKVGQCHEMKWMYGLLCFAAFSLLFDE
jgi:hypothetical protein